MTLWQILRPTLVSTLVMGVAFALAGLWLGTSAATRVAFVVFVLSSLAVLSLWFIVAVLAIRLPQLRIVLSVVNAAAFWFMVRIFVPLSNVCLLIFLFVTNDLELFTFASTLKAIASERGTFERVGVGLSFLICALFVDKALAALGYPGAIVHDHDARWARLQSRTALLICGAIGTAFALLVPLPIGGTIPMIVALGLFIILVGFFLSWHFARRVHRAALVVCPYANTSAPTNPWALHVTDVHLTLPGTARVEGGGGGRNRLAALVATRRMQVARYLFLSGDVTDHGHVGEWDEAAKVLAPLRATGCRLLVAPGNHDLSMAYDGTSQFRAQVALHAYGMTRQMEYKYGIRFLNYLKFQSCLADDVMLAEGQRLSSYVRDKSKTIADEEQLLRSVATLGKLDEIKLAEFLDRLIAEGRMHPTRKDRYAQILRNNSCDHLAGFDPDKFEITKGFLGLSLAEDVFPMRLVDNQADAEIFILNSVVVDDTLVASASGNLAEEQLKRFEKAVAKSRSRNLVVLMHHAPFRWEDERSPRFGPDSLRWSSLAMSNKSGKRFIEPLAAAVMNGKTAIFCCGHRHGGSDMATRFGSLSGVIVSEGAALADPGTQIAALTLTSGAPHLGILPLP